MLKISDGFTLVEVLIALVIIMGIASVAYKHHMSMLMHNHALLNLENMTMEKSSDFLLEYGVPE